MWDTDLVVIHSFGSQPEADIAKGALEANGIDAIIQADSVGGMRPHVAWEAADSKCSFVRKMQRMHVRCLSLSREQEL